MRFKLVDLFSPTILIFFPIMIQLITWTTMSEEGFFTFIKYREPFATHMFWAFCLVTACGIIAAKCFQQKTGAICENHNYQSGRVMRYVLFVFVVFMFAELYYVRNLVFSGRGLGALLSVGTQNIAETTVDFVKYNKNIFLTPFVESSYFLIAILSYIVYSQSQFTPKAVSLAKKLLWVVGGVVFFNSFFLGMRTVLVFNFLIFIFIKTWSIKRKVSLVSIAKYGVISVVAILLIYGVFEYFRSGMQYMRDQDSENLSKLTVYTYLIQRFSVLYVANNHQNMLTYFGEGPRWTLFDSAHFVDKLVRQVVGIKFQTLEPVQQLGQYRSAYGRTVVLYGLLYRDIGWLAYPFVFFVTYFFQRLYQALHSKSMIVVLIYALSVPVLVSFCRTNQLGNSAFIMPMFFCLLFYFLNKRVDPKLSGSMQAV